MLESTLRKNGHCVVHLAQQREAALVLREPALDRRAEAVPAGQHQAALAPAEHPRNRAQVLDARRRRARRRPAADVELGDLGDRRGRAEIGSRTPAFRRRARDRLRARWPRARRSRGDNRRARSPMPSASARLASIVAATSASRLRRPSSGSEYLLAMISPCSVTRRPPVTLPAGCARIASYDGPPPRPTVPPRPWNRRSLTPCAANASTRCISAR